MRTRVKFCGITNAKDAHLAVKAGVDAIGLVFYPPAKTYVDIENASVALSNLPPFVSIVALFVNEKPDTVRQTIDAIRPHYLQFHGDEAATYCEQFGVRYIKACRVKNSEDIIHTIEAHPKASAILLDSYHKSQYGGTGTSFDSHLIPDIKDKPLIVAGGLDSHSVSYLIQQKRPWGVDVSSKISTEDNKRKKDWSKMSAFIQNVRRADDN